MYFVNDKLLKSVAEVDNEVDLEELNDHIQRSDEALKTRSKTLNEDKTDHGVEQINILGYEIEKGRIAPDENR